MVQACTFLSSSNIHVIISIFPFAIVNQPTLSCSIVFTSTPILYHFVHLCNSRTLFFQRIPGTTRVSFMLT